MNGAITIRRRQFAGAQEVLREIGGRSQWPVTASHSSLPAGPLHTHPHATTIYVLSGAITVHYSETSAGHDLAPGDVAEIPADTLHCVSIPLHAVTITAFPEPQFASHSEKFFPESAARKEGPMGTKLCPKIILEGTRLTKKTEIAFLLNEHPRIVGPRKYRYHSPLVSAEWCAFTNYPWGRGLINFDDAEEPLAMETYRTWIHLFELQKYYSWIVDRFHISTMAYQQSHRGKQFDFRWLEERLLPLGFRVVLCTRAPGTFEKARHERLKVSGKPSQYDDLTQFIREQELMQKIVDASILPSLTLEISDLSITAAADEIADWLETTGGLTM